MVQEKNNTFRKINIYKRALQVDIKRTGPEEMVTRDHAAGVTGKTDKWT